VGNKAIVLLSGGLDSATALAVAGREGFDQRYALSFRYGQRHEVELAAAERVAAAGGVVAHLIVDVDLAAIGGSALTGDFEVPHRAEGEPPKSGIPVTYVPARNTVFLALALAWSEVLDCGDIYIGVNALDYSGYPDCRPEFIAAFEAMANLATARAVEGRGGLRVHAPLVGMTKADIVRLGLELGVDFSLTHSCYDPQEGGRPCGTCDSCLIRARGFEQAGVPDPALHLP